jgi:hypothetical protein
MKTLIILPFMNLRALAIALAAVAVPLLLIGPACREAYVAPVVSTNTHFLVVEGFINNGSDSTLFNLTRSFKLDDTSSLQPELHAQVDVEGKDNSSFPLTEIGNGQYGVASLGLNNAIQYRLHIRTSAGKDYLSDFVDLKVSPPIDSINWKRTDSGLQIYANTHDPQAASRYYRWEYQQTWQFNSIFYSTEKYNGLILVPRVNDFYTCWKSANSSGILLASTAKLSQDVIAEYPLVLIPPDSWLISLKYSILVKQYTLSAEAYQFWSDLQKNSEQLGSIFSPEPFQTKGNIHAVGDSSEMVIGYISAGTSRQQRIYIVPYDIPNWGFGSYQVGCRVFSTPNVKDSLEFYLAGFTYLPIGPTMNGGNANARFDYALSSCIDCRLTGTTIKPLFWQ